MSGGGAVACETLLGEIRTPSRAIASSQIVVTYARARVWTSRRARWRQMRNPVLRIDYCTHARPCLETRRTHVNVDAPEWRQAAIVNTPRHDTPNPQTYILRQMPLRRDRVRPHTRAKRIIPSARCAPMGACIRPRRLSCPQCGKTPPRRPSIAFLGGAPAPAPSLPRVWLEG